MSGKAEKRLALGGAGQRKEGARSTYNYIFVDLICVFKRLFLKPE